MKIKEPILKEEGYISEKKFTRDVYELHALTKIDQYKAECEFFNDKYGIDLRTFEQQLHKEKGNEEIEKEEDLEDWEFADKALNWWKNRLKDLQRATDT